KGLTQEELAEALFVSRTAVSKWESGRGYPNIDSLKAIAKFFGITVDELLSGDELLTIAEKDNEQKENHIRELVFGLLDISVSMLLFLPFFGQKVNDTMQSVSLLSLNGIAPYLRTVYLSAVIGITVFGILILALQKSQPSFLNRNKYRISLILNAVAVSLFIISTQPYAAILLFIFLVIKGIMLIKHQ
ncbi:MAG: helix-turn-helix transcriptional regulator, partial [Acutalibacteraceae bacterium]|nr:helix-turn-helix transcriptional regulator [Acutalibacteraceae bacterium]